MDYLPILIYQKLKVDKKYQYIDKKIKAYTRCFHDVINLGIYESFV